MASSSSSASFASSSSSGGGGRGPPRPAALYRPEFVVVQSFNFGFDDEVGWSGLSVFCALLRTECPPRVGATTNKLTRTWRQHLVLEQK